VRTDVNMSDAELAKNDVEKAGDAKVAESVIYVEVDQPKTSASNDPFDKAEVVKCDMPFLFKPVTVFKV